MKKFIHIFGVVLLLAVPCSGQLTFGDSTNPSPALGKVFSYSYPILLDTTSDSTLAIELKSIEIMVTIVDDTFDLINWPWVDTTIAVDDSTGVAITWIYSPDDVVIAYPNWLSTGFLVYDSLGFVKGVGVAIYIYPDFRYNTFPDDSIINGKDFQQLFKRLWGT